MIPGCIAPFMLTEIAKAVKLTLMQSNQKMTGISGNVTIHGYATGPSYTIMVSSNGAVYKTTDGITWTYISTIGFSVGQRAVIYANSKFVVLGTAGQVATSTDGVTWTSSTSLSSGTWGTRSCYGIVWTGTKFVIVGNSAGCATSTDGVTWTWQASLGTAIGTSIALLGLVWSGSKLVTVGTSGKCATSTDGITWTNQASFTTAAGTISAGRSLLWTGSQFVAGVDGAAILTSPDGVTWTKRTGLQTLGWSGAITSLVVFSSKIVAFSAATSQVLVATSTDGITWSNTMSTNFQNSGMAGGFVYSTIVLGTKLLYGAQSGRLGYTTDLVSFVRTTNIYVDWGGDVPAGVVDNGRSFFQIGSGGAISKSTDGVNWTFLYSMCIPNYTKGSDWGVAAVDVANNRLLVLNSYSSSSGSGDGFLITLDSNDNVSLVQEIELPVTSGNLVKAYCFNGVFYATTNSGGPTILKSTDGFNWSVMASTFDANWSTYSITAMASNGSMLVAGGGGGRIATSVDGGLTWVTQTAMTGVTWFGSATARSIIWTGSKFVACGTQGRILISYDGINWDCNNNITTTSWGTKAIYHLAWTGSRLFVASSEGYYAASPDGVTWSETDVLTDPVFGLGVLISSICHKAGIVSIAAVAADYSSASPAITV